jgi:hypothetical protein
MQLYLMSFLSECVLTSCNDDYAFSFFYATLSGWSYEWPPKINGRATVVRSTTSELFHPYAAIYYCEVQYCREL